MRVEMSPLDARVVSDFCVDESLATVPVALVVFEAFNEPEALVLFDVLEVEELGSLFDATEAEPLFALSFEVSVVPVVLELLLAGVFAATSVEDEVPEVELVFDEADGVAAVLAVSRCVSVASEESEEFAVEEREFLSELVLKEPLPLAEPLAASEPLALSELFEVEAVGAPETLFCAALLLLSAVVDEDDDGEDDELNDELLLLFALLFWLEP